MTPATPGEVIRGFLGALGVPPASLPASAQAQAAPYRSLLAGRSMLVVLDNARDAEQVRPLLLGSPGCAVVVTSRNQLTGLVVAEGAWLSLGRFPSRARPSCWPAGWDPRGCRGSPARPAS